MPPSRPHSWRLRGWPGTQAPLSPFLCGQLRLGAHKHFPGNALLLISCWWYVYEPISWRLLVKAFSAASARAHLPLRNTCTVGMLRTGISEPMWALPLNSKGTKTYRTYLGLPHPHHFFFFPQRKMKESDNYFYLPPNCTNYQPISSQCDRHQLWKTHRDKLALIGFPLAV